MPTRVIGGYGCTGNAWHFQIPEKIRQKVLTQNNSLEFAASIISVLIAMTSKYIYREKREF
jgi:hypothetical protein